MSFSSQDDCNGKIIKLLKLLVQYDLLLEQMQKSCSDGFYHLSRANYHNKDTLRGKYGRDYWDSMYMGHLTAKFDGSGHVSIEKSKTSLHKEEQLPKKHLSTIRNRNARSGNHEKGEKVCNYDPIIMFGGGLTVPSSLRNCQSDFQSCIPLIAQLVNRRKEIVAVVNEIDKTNE